MFQVKELDDKNGVKTDAIGRIMRAKNQRALIDCTDANNNTPLSEASSQLTVNTGVNLLTAQCLHAVLCSQMVCSKCIKLNNLWISLHEKINKFIIAANTLHFFCISNYEMSIMSLIVSA